VTVPVAPVVPDVTVKVSQDGGKQPNSKGSSTKTTKPGAISLLVNSSKPVSLVHVDGLVADTATYTPFSVPVVWPRSKSVSPSFSVTPLIGFGSAVDVRTIFANDSVKTLACGGKPAPTSKKVTKLPIGAAFRKPPAAPHSQSASTLTELEDPNSKPISIGSKKLSSPITTPPGMVSADIEQFGVLDERKNSKLSEPEIVSLTLVIVTVVLAVPLGSITTSEGLETSVMPSPKASSNSHASPIPLLSESI